jgi:hypothetical protein
VLGPWRKKSILLKRGVKKNYEAVQIDCHKSQQNRGSVTFDIMP